MAPKYGSAFGDLDGPTNQAHLEEYEIMSPRFGYTTSTIASGMLSACQASREVLLKFHTGKIITSAPIIRFSKELDSIFLWSRLSFNSTLHQSFAEHELIHENVFQDVQNLTLLQNDFHHNRLQDYVEWLVRYFRGLRTLGLIYNAYWEIDDVLDEGAPLKLHTPEVALAMNCTTATTYKNSLLFINQCLKEIKSDLQKAKENDSLWKEPTLEAFRIPTIEPKEEFMQYLAWAFRFSA